MDRNSFIKISATIFVLLAVIISLFPPFEFGKSSYNLPVKKYDFIFGSIKKNIILDYYTFHKKFYSKDSVEFYKNLWSDKEFQFSSASIDSFFTAKIFLYKENKSLRGEPDSHRYYDFSKLRAMGDDIIWAGDSKSNQSNKKKYNFTFTKPSYDVDNSRYDNGRIIKYDDDRRDAINYNEVKNQYDKSSNDWDFYYVDVFDSAKKFNSYDITQPVYYLLERKLLFGELFVEYILAFLISIILGYISQKIPIFKKLKVGFLK